MNIQAETLLRELFGCHDVLKSMYFYLWTLNDDGKGGTTRPYLVSDYLSAANDSLMFSNCYFGLALSDKMPISKQRITQKSTSALSCLWLDIDFQSEFRNKESLPAPDADISFAFEGLPRPSIKVDSGYGLHCYWLFNKPELCFTSTGQANLASLVRSWNLMFIDRFKEHGYNLDASSIAQVLRVPGTANTKDEFKPIDVSIIGDSDSFTRYDANDLFRLCSSKVKAIEAKAPSAPRGSDAEFVLDPAAIVSEETLEIYFEAYKIFKMVWEGKKVYPSQSERDAAIAAMLSGIACSDQEIVDALVHNRRELGEPEKLRSDYYRRTLDNASKSYLSSRGRLEVRKVQDIKECMDNGGTVVIETEEYKPSKVELETELQLRTRIAELTGIDIMSIMKLPTATPSYRVMFRWSGVEREMLFPTIKELTNQKFFLERIMEATDRFIAPMKKLKWEKVCALMLPMVIEETMITGLTDDDAFKGKVKEFINSCNIPEVTPDAWTGGEHEELPSFILVTDAGTKFLHTTAREFQRWHNREGFPERLSVPDINLHFYNIKGRSVEVKEDGYHRTMIKLRLQKNMM